MSFDQQVVDKYISDLQNTLELDQKVINTQNICILALAIGPEHTQALFEKLHLAYTNQPEEIAVAIAFRLGDLVRLTSYDATKIPEKVISSLFTHIENLSAINSHIINNNLANSFQVVLSFYETNTEPFVQFIQKLLQSTTTLQRALCVQLIPILYAKLPVSDTTHKPVLGTTFGSLISDADSYVRSQAAAALSTFITQIVKTKQSDKFVYTPSYIFVCYDRLVQDLSDQVRNCNVTNGVLVLKFLLQLKDTLDTESRESREIKEVLPALIKNISRGSSDRYWKIRMTTALQMPDFFELIHKKLDIQDCAVMFRLLCEDCEQDIRIQTIKNSDQILKYLDQNTIVNIFCPTLLGRANEKEQLKVKVALCQQLGQIIEHVRSLQHPDEVKQIVFTTAQDCCKKLYQDKQSEVRQEVIKEIHQLYSIDPNFVQEMITTVMQNKQEKWIVKCALIKAISDLVQKGESKVKQLVEEVISLIVDDAYKTRKDLANLIVTASMKFEVDWLGTILDKIIRFAKSNTSNYQNRVSCAMCLVGVLKAYLKFRKDTGLSDIAAILTQYATGKSVYVRQQIVQSIHDLLQFAADCDGDMYPPVKKLICDLLTKLEVDENKEVQDEAEELKGTLEAFD